MSCPPQGHGSYHSTLKYWNMFTIIMHILFSCLLHPFCIKLNLNFYSLDNMFILSAYTVVLSYSLFMDQNLSHIFILSMYGGYCYYTELLSYCMFLYTKWWLTNVDCVTTVCCHTLTFLNVVNAPKRLILTAYLLLNIQMIFVFIGHLLFGFAYHA